MFFFVISTAKRVRLVSALHHVLPSDRHAFRAGGCEPRPYNAFRHIVIIRFAGLKHALCSVIVDTNVKKLKTHKVVSHAHSYGQ